MGARNSTSTRPRSFSSSDDGSASGALGLSAGMAMAGYLGGPSSSNGAARARASSIPGFGPGRHGHGVSIPTSNGGAHGAGSPDSDSSPDEGPFRGFMQASSLPPLGGLLIHGIKCPVCSKYVPPDDIECHLVMCLTKPRITYNEDILQEDKGECVICLDDLVQGDTIARLPCLCIYHKSCIDAWFERNRSCPEHPQE
ncbi:E3 ubiquitin-protein ligase ZNRF2-like [Lineus longissimus]|uniref:E3 ubiquitin-protein ligase ZNRF2-like n=1 Tax=Lineus longissimus TaxID=88925 RepID=UPI00315D5BF3